MPSPKKTNYISYKIKKLEKYFKQLEQYMDDNPPDTADDRIEILETERGQAIKVICKKEEQIKLFKETLKELPALLENLNKLRKAVNGEEEDKEVRGGHDIPGFMRKRKKRDKPFKKDEKVEINEEFDDDEPDEHKDQLFLPGSPELEVAEEIDAEEVEPEEEEEEYDDQWEED